MEKKIEDFLTENFLFEFDEETTRQTDLFKAGLIDSMGYIKLVRFCEKEFGIAFTDEELLLNVLVDFDSIVSTVRQKAGA